jgi:hypothetical protein
MIFSRQIKGYPMRNRYFRNSFPGVTEQGYSSQESVVRQQSWSKGIGNGEQGTKIFHESFLIAISRFCHFSISLIRKNQVE